MFGIGYHFTAPRARLLRANAPLAAFARVWGSLTHIRKSWRANVWLVGVVTAGSTTTLRRSARAS